MISIEQALEHVIQYAVPKPAQSVPLEKSLGHLLWEDIFSGGDFKPADMVDLVTTILSTIFPEPKKKSSTSNVKPKKSAKKKASTRGKNSTS